jgi:negative elongation factor B
MLMVLLSRDLSMILCDPFSSNTLVLSTVRNLQELLSQDALPRVRHSMFSFVALCFCVHFHNLSMLCGDLLPLLKGCFCVNEQDSPDLMLLLRMLSLGQGAWDMIDSQVFKEPRLVCSPFY